MNESEENRNTPVGCLGCASPEQRKRMLEAFAEKGIRVELVSDASANTSPNVIECPLCDRRWEILSSQRLLNS